VSRGQARPVSRWPRDADQARCAASAAGACNAASDRAHKRDGFSTTANGGSPCAPWRGVSDCADGPDEIRGHVLSSSCRQRCVFGVLRADDVGWQSPPWPSSHRACRTARSLAGNCGSSFLVLCQIFPIVGPWPTEQCWENAPRRTLRLAEKTRRQLTENSRCPRSLRAQAVRQ